MCFSFSVWHGQIGSKKKKKIHIAYISIPPPAIWHHTDMPAGYGSIFISHSTFSFSVTLLMPAYGYSSGQLMPALVCVRGRGGES